MEIKVIDKFGCVFHKPNNICGNAKITSTSQQVDQDQWKKNNEKQHLRVLDPYL